MAREGRGQREVGREREIQKGKEITLEENKKGKGQHGCTEKQRCRGTHMKRKRQEGRRGVRCVEIWEVGVKIEKDSKTQMEKREKHIQRNTESLEERRGFYQEVEAWGL